MIRLKRPIPALQMLIHTTSEYRPTDIKRGLAVPQSLRQISAHHRRWIVKIPPEDWSQFSVDWPLARRLDDAPTGADSIFQEAAGPLFKRLHCPIHGGRFHSGLIHCQLALEFHLRSKKPRHPHLLLLQLINGQSLCSNRMPRPHRFIGCSRPSERLLSAGRSNNSQKANPPAKSISGRPTSRRRFLSIPTE